MTSNDHFSNKSIAELLRNIAAAYQLQEGSESGKNNRFRIIAYEKAADTIEHLSRELRDIWYEGKLYKITGIGSGIGSALEEIFTTGESQHFNEILKGIPQSVFLLMKVPGIGPKKAFRLVFHFGLTDTETVVHELRNLARANKVADLEGFGTKSQDDILEGLNIFERKDKREERMSISYAMEIASGVIQYMKKLGTIIKRIDSLGSLRRRVATIGDIDIAVAIDEIIEGSDPQSAHMRVRPSQAIIDHFLKYPGKRSVEAAGERKASILAAGNIRIDLRVQDSESYGSMLQYLTGSKAHNIKLREYALKKGYSLSEYGMKVVKRNNLRHSDPPADGEESIKKFKDEKSLYSFLGLQTPPPEIREGTSEIYYAKRGMLPKLVTIEDIKGDFHLHSSYDLKPSHDLGLDTYEEMVRKAKELQYEYIGFSEHNPKQSGLSENDVKTIMEKRKRYIDSVMKPLHFPYFIGLEVDILPDGRIALPESAIEYVDYLIVSLHSSFTMDMQKMTTRVLRALSYPKVKIFGHPTARLLGKRDGVEMDWDQIFDQVKKNNQALEINAAPSRLDLPDSLVKEGVEKGAKFIIDTDAHAVVNMDWMKYGVDVARRGWLTEKDVVNTWSYPKIKKWFNSAFKSPSVSSWVFS